MPESKREELNSNALPFFARYLEGQFCEDLSEEEMDKIQGGSKSVFREGKLSKVSEQIRKQISNRGKEIAVTLKYPSDNEDSSGGGDLGVLVTKKYPSDHEEHGNLKVETDGISYLRASIEDF